MIKTIRVQMLGGLRVEADGEVLIGPGEENGKPWQLFCFVLLNHAAPCTQTRLTANLWRGLSPADPAGTLRRTLEALDKEFGCEPGAGEGPVQYVDELYRRNPHIKFVLDTENFEKSCQKAAKANPTALNAGGGKRQVELYVKAAALYSGALLPRLDSENWVTPLARYFAKLYLECVTALCEGLWDEQRHTQLLETATAATLLEPLEEQYYLYIFRALRALDMSRVIIPTYHRAARVFMEELGMALGEEIQAIYAEASGQVDAVEQDVMIVRDDLLEVMNDNRPGSGPLYCSYEVFKYLYQVVARASERAGRRVAVLLLSLEPAPGEEAPPPRVVSMAMNQIRTLALGSLLRRSDTVARFAQNQYVIMLSVESREGADTAVERIQKECAPLLARTDLQLRFAPVEVEPPA